MGLPYIFYAVLIRPILNHDLTHLEILFPSASNQSWGKWDVLTQVPQLTYISDLIQHGKYYSSLQCLGVEGNRLVLLEAENYVDVIFDWEKGAEGRVDTWMFSELVVLTHDSE